MIYFRKADWYLDIAHRQDVKIYLWSIEQLSS